MSNPLFYSGIPYFGALCQNRDKRQKGEDER